MDRVVIAPARRAADFGRLLRRTFFAAVEHDAFTVAQAAAYSAMVALVSGAGGDCGGGGAAAAVAPAEGADGRFL